MGLRRAAIALMCLAVLWPAAVAWAADEPATPTSLANSRPLPQAQITWRVENPFRFFADPADTEVHRATWLALSPEERLTPILSAERQLARRSPEGWAAAMTGPLCWDAEKNRFACPGDKDAFAAPRFHRVLVSAEGIPDAADLTCSWLTAPRGGQNRRGIVVDVPCSEPATIEIPYPFGAGLTLEIGGQRVAQTLIKVADLFIVGMGDSFASGEGNPDLPIRFSRERSVDYGDAKDQLTGYPARVGQWKTIGDKQFISENARWLDQACHRSVYANQLRAALQLAVEDPHRAVTFAGVACSGAEIVSGLFLRYKGNEWVPNPPSSRKSRRSRRCSAAVSPRRSSIFRKRTISAERSPSCRAGSRSRSASRNGHARSISCCCRSAATTSVSRVSSPTRC